jgi:hypothetical protein
MPSELVAEARRLCEKTSSQYYETAARNSLQELRAQQPHCAARSLDVAAQTQEAQAALSLLDAQEAALRPQLADLRQARREFTRSSPQPNVENKYKRCVVCGERERERCTFVCIGPRPGR